MGAPDTATQIAPTDAVRTASSRHYDRHSSTIYGAEVP